MYGSFGEYKQGSTSEKTTYDYSSNVIDTSGSAPL